MTATKPAAKSATLARMNAQLKKGNLKAAQAIARNAPETKALQAAVQAQGAATAKKAAPAAKLSPAGESTSKALVEARLAATTGQAPAPGGKPAIGAGSPKLDRTLARAEAKEKAAAMPKWRPVPTPEFKAKVAGKKVHLRTDRNPKHGKSAERYGLYREGMSVEQAVAAGLSWLDLMFDASPHHSWLDAKGARQTGAYIELK